MAKKPDVIPSAGKGKKFCSKEGCNTKIGVNTKVCPTCNEKQPTQGKKFSKKRFAKDVLLYALNHTGKTEISKPEGKRPTIDDFLAARSDKAKMDKLMESADAWDVYDCAKGIPKDVREMITEMMKEYNVT